MTNAKIKFEMSKKPLVEEISGAIKVEAQIFFNRRIIVSAIAWQYFYFIFIACVSSKENKVNYTTRQDNDMRD